MRSADFKRDKDLFYVYFILKFHPDRKKLFETLGKLKKDDYFQDFRKNLKEYLSDISRPGYLILRPFLRTWIEEGKIHEEIETVFSDVMRML